MKKLFSLGASVSVTGFALLVSVDSANAAIFSVGDSLSGSSGGNGLVGIGVDTANPLQPARNFFGVVAPAAGGVTISPAVPGQFPTFSYAPIQNPAVAPTTTAPTTFGLNATGGFAPLIGGSGRLRSFESAVNPDLSAGFTSVVNFLTASVVGFDLRVNLNGKIESSVGAGNSLSFDVPVEVFADNGIEQETVNGIFRFSTQNISNAFAVGSGDGLIDVFTGGQTYSWELDIVESPAVPEPSSMVSLLALGVIGGGAALKRKALK